MEPVQRVAESREQAAVRELGQSQQHLAAQEARLEEFLSYREQYTKSFQASGEAGFGAARLQEYRVFLGRLNDAIRQQEEVIIQCRAQCEAVRQRWIESRTHSQAIDKVMDRYREDEYKQQERREQKDQDERSQRSPGKPDRK